MKYISLLLILGMVFSLGLCVAACDRDDDDDNDNDDEADDDDTSDDDTSDDDSGDDDAGDDDADDDDTGDEILIESIAGGFPGYRALSLAVAPDGRYFLVAEYARRLMVYSRAPSGAWEQTELPYNVKEAVLAIAENGDLYIGCHELGGGVLLMQGADRAWQATVIDDQADAGHGLDMTPDEQGVLHFSYVDRTAGELKYATYDPATAQANVESTGLAAQAMKTTLALGTDGAVHVSFSQVEDEVWYATNADGVWRCALVPGSDYANHDILVDSTGVVHLGTSIYLALHRDYSVWIDNALLGQNWRIVNGWSTDGQFNLPIDFHERDDVGREMITTGPVAKGVWLMRLRADPVLWQPEDIVMTGDVSRLSAAYDAQGGLHTAYAGNEDAALRIVDEQADTWATTTIASGAFVSPSGGEADIVVDAQDRLHVAYFASPDLSIFGSLWYAIKNDDRWVSVLVADSIYAEGRVELKIDAQGRSHFVYGGLFYSTCDDECHTQQISQGVNWDTDSDLALDEQGHAHVCWMYEGLHYLNNVQGEWVEEKIDDQTVWWSHCDIELDAAGRAVIAYRRGSDQLVVVRRTDDSWSGELVEMATVIGGPSLALDENGLAHLAYQKRIDDSNYELRYATDAGGSWNIVTVTQGMQAASGPELALDATGRPQVVYGNSSPLTLMIAALTDDGWRLRALDEHAGSGLPGLAFDSTGEGHVAYVSDYALFHASFTPAEESAGR